MAKMPNQKANVERLEMKPRWHARWRALAVAVDALFVSAAMVAWTAARFGPQAVQTAFVPAPGRDFGRAPLAFAIPVWLGVFAAVRLYNPQRCQNALQEARRLVTAGPSAAVGLVMLGFLVKENPARSWLVGALVLGTLAASIGRQTLRGIVVGLRERGSWTTPTVVVGRNEAKGMVDALLADRSSGIDPVATCGFEWPGLPSWPLTHLPEAVRAGSAGEILVVAEDLERHEVRAAVEVADELPVHVVVLPGLDHLLLGSLQLVTVVNEPGLALEAPSLRGYQGALKRAIDAVAGALLLAVTAPLVALVAVAIRLDSPGPVFFRQRREGMGGKTFDVVKFRTMYDGAVPVDLDEIDPEDLSFLAKPQEDPRITRLGRFLRRTSLDELPQLWNVMLGDMSLVGPRPLRMWEAERLGLRRRLVVRPGITGLWQVSGRSTLSPEERIRLDLVYVQNWNLLLDLSILLRTVPAVIARRGAY